MDGSLRASHFHSRRRYPRSSKTCPMSRRCASVDDTVRWSGVPKATHPISITPLPWSILISEATPQAIPSRSTAWVTAVEAIRSSTRSRTSCRVRGRSTGR